MTALALRPTRLVGLTRALPRDPAAIAFSRRELRRLGEEGLRPARLADLELVVSELVTNALVHGTGAIRLDVELVLGGVRGAVADEGGGFRYEAAEPAPDEPGGRGLRIVDALTGAWGVEPGRSLVWFQMSP